MSLSCNAHHLRTRNELGVSTTISVHLGDLNDPGELAPTNRGSGPFSG